MPSIDRVDRASTLTNTLTKILAAGIAAEVVFEFLGLLIAPLIFGAPMLPARLVVALGSLAGLSLPAAAGWAGHLLAGIVLFPLGYVLLRRVLRNRGWVFTGVLYGLVLWLIAQGILAPLVGRPSMLGFVPYTWGSVVAHLLYTLTLAHVLHRLRCRDASAPVSPTR